MICASIALSANTPVCKSTCLSIHTMTLLLLASNAQELSVLRCALPTPCLAPDTHRHRCDHAEHYHDAVESEDGAHTSGIDEVLQRLVDGEVDARRANGENNDNFARNLSMKSALQHKFVAESYLHPGSSPLHTQWQYYTH